MKFPTENTTMESAKEAATWAAPAALEHSIRHWAYIAAYEPTVDSRSHSCSLCYRYVLKQQTCCNCPLYEAGQRCNYEESPYYIWGNDKTQENALNMLNALLHIAEMKPVTMEELP